MRSLHKYGVGLLMFWTITTTIFSWLPLVRIMANPDGYQWGLLGLSGAGTTGPFWVFILLTIYVLTMLYSGHRGPRALFFPMLIPVISNPGLPA